MELTALDLTTAVNFLHFLFRALRSVIEQLLVLTIFKANPELAFRYADATTLLVTLTAVWIVFEFLTAAKKIIRIIVVLGWFLLFVSLFIASRPMSL